MAKKKTQQKTALYIPHERLSLLCAQVRTYLPKLFRYFGLSVLCAGLLVAIIDIGVSLYVRADVYENTNELPFRPYGLVLGTSRYFSDNSLNLFYYNRLLAAQKLIKNHKVDYLLLSGDNRQASYNEPRNMFKDLRKLGVDTDFLYLDFAGFRTLDSVIRAKNIFHAHAMTIISQRFHCERALFIAKYYDINAICFVADYPEGHYGVRVRELLARVYMLWDLLTQTKPHFLGKPEPLPPPLMVEP